MVETQLVRVFPFCSVTSHQLFRPTDHRIAVCSAITSTLCRALGFCMMRVLVGPPQRLRLRHRAVVVVVSSIFIVCCELFLTSHMLTLQSLFDFLGTNSDSFIEYLAKGNFVTFSIIMTWPHIAHRTLSDGFCHNFFFTAAFVGIDSADYGAMFRSFHRHLQSI